MTHKNEATLQHFAHMLVLQNIPPLKVPDDALEHIQRVGKSFFSTTKYIHALSNILSLEHMQEQYKKISLYDSALKGLQQEANKNHLHFFGCGISGYGIQNWKFQYFLSSPSLHIMLSIPYGNAYGNAEEERTMLTYSLTLIELCLRHFLQEKEKTLSLIFHNKLFAYCVHNAHSENMYEGHIIDDFLDMLTKRESPRIDQNMWV